MWRASYKYSKTYSDKPMLLKLAQAMKNDVGNFKPHVPLVMIMCNKGLRDRHWDQIGEVVGFSVRPTEKTGLVDIIERNLTPFLPKLEEISESASKEWSLEKNLDKQLSQWQDAVFLLQPYRDSGTSILSGSCVDEIQTILDDQVVRLGCTNCVVLIFCCEETRFQLSSLCVTESRHLISLHELNIILSR